MKPIGLLPAILPSWAWATLVASGLMPFVFPLLVARALWLFASERLGS